MASIAQLAPLGAGSFAYWAFFHRGEHFLYGVRYMQVFLMTIAAGTIFLMNSTQAPIKSAFSTCVGYGGLFLLGVYANCIIFRLFFNPLNSFPGPYFARLSKFDHVFRNAKFDGHHVLLKLHKKYGKFVRIGPNDISVIDADGVQVISGPKTTCYKAPWYGNDAPLTSLHTTRDRAMHDRRRRVWSPAFSDKALRGYELRVASINDQLIAQLDKTEGTPVNAVDLLNLYSFDVMGDLAFGKTFDCLATGKKHWAIKLLEEGMDPLGLSFPGWFFRTLTAIPGAAKGYHDFIAFCTKQLENRIEVQGKTDPDKPDITQTLIEQYQSADKSAQKDMWPMLCGDSRLIIVAGSDTTAATLSHMFYHLASKPKWQTALREEVERLKKGDGPFEDAWIKDAPIMNGIINESLRLNPPVPSGVFRTTPSEGVMIGKTFVPGHTTIQMPQYVMARDEDSYVKADQFIPERWYESPEMIKHKDAFAPFSTGPYGCIGKNLAYMEMRTIVARILLRFDVKLADGEDGSTLLYKSTDHFTTGLMPLKLVFTRRES